MFGKVVDFRDTNETTKGYDAVLAGVHILEVLKGNLKVSSEIWDSRKLRRRGRNGARTDDLQRDGRFVVVCA